MVMELLAIGAFEVEIGIRPPNNIDERIGLSGGHGPLMKW